jgi:hypothetical protein
MLQNLSPKSYSIRIYHHIDIITSLEKITLNLYEIAWHNKTYVDKGNGFYRAECNHKIKLLQNEYHYFILINAIIIVHIPFFKVLSQTKVAHELEKNVEVLKLRVNRV